MNNRDIIEIQNFNRSVLTKNSYTRSDIEYIIRLYNICLEARQDTHMCVILNKQFEKIITLAQNQITAFSNGKVHLSPDAYKPMGEFIRQFGQEYVNKSTGLKYEFTPAARRAQIMLNKMNSRLSVKNINKTNSCAQSPNISQTQIIRNYHKNNSSLVTKENVFAQLRKHLPASNNTLSIVKNKVDSYFPKLEQQTKDTIKRQTKVIKHIGNEASEVGEEVYKSVSNIVRRYGAAAALLWGMCGAGNMNNIGAKDVVKSIKENKIEYIQPQPTPVEQNPTTKVLTVNDFAPQQEITPKTVADITFNDYKFTKEDLQSLEVSEQGAELALHARKVARNMNYPGYCYRGVKRMFNLANLGEMHGRSAYMAKKYLDNNPNFVRINVNVSDLEYLPKGTVVVFDKGKRGVHPHGHIGVFDEVNGKIVDRSSKTYNVRSTLGGYSGVYVYIHADTPLPQKLKDNINKMVALDKNKKDNTAITDYFTQLAIQKSGIKHV